MFGGLAELLRNFALVAFGAPFVEPFLTGQPINDERAAFGGVFGVVFVVFALILDHERSD